MSNSNILGCFVSSMIGDENGALFRSYIYGTNGMAEYLKKLINTDYGEDLRLILFQFYVNPIPYLVQNLKEIEGYRKKEKSIGIPIIITNENFFNRSESDRYDFFRISILKKMELLDYVIKKKKLDTNMDLLISDLKKILINYI